MVLSSVKVYVFLRQRPIDSEPWPLVFANEALANHASDRVSQVIEIELVPDSQKQLPLDPQ
jgi:hypothetical protein